MTITPEPDSDPPALTTGASDRGVGVRATWGVRDLVIGGVAVILLLAAVVALAGLVIEVLDYEERSSGRLAVEALSSAVWELAVAFTIYRLVRRKGGDWRNLGLVWPRQPVSGARDPSVGRWARLVVGGYLASVVLVFGYQIIVRALGLGDLLPDQQIPDEYFDHDIVIAMIAFSAVVAAPFAEEVFFRGFLHAGLRRRLSFLPAALISGFCFSLAHADVGLIVPFAGVGVVFAYLYERTGTLYASIGTHFVFNAVSVVVLIAAERS